jgi:hypothetical protein
LPQTYDPSPESNPEKNYSSEGKGTSKIHPPTIFPKGKESISSQQPTGPPENRGHKKKPEGKPELSLPPQDHSFAHTLAPDYLLSVSLSLCLSVYVQVDVNLTDSSSQNFASSFKLGG